jgi:hypothetical protein
MSSNLESRKLGRGWWNAFFTDIASRATGNLRYYLPVVKERHT